VFYDQLANYHHHHYRRHLRGLEL